MLYLWCISFGNLFINLVTLISKRRDLSQSSKKDKICWICHKRSLNHYGGWNGWVFESYSIKDYERVLL